MNIPSHPSADTVLDFWFGETSERGKTRAQWFQKDSDFDNEIRSRFLSLHEQVIAGNLASWKNDPYACLALIILLDQFPRNMFRDSARAFASDPLARDVAEYALDQKYDDALKPIERTFIYLPLEHSESLADQERCVGLMKSLSAFPETAEAYIWAEKHRDIIKRFGRFPHRNTVLGRASNNEEIEFLKQPGSGF